MHLLTKFDNIKSYIETLPSPNSEYSESKKSSSREKDLNLSDMLETIDISGNRDELGLQNLITYWKPLVKGMVLSNILGSQNKVSMVQNDDLEAI